ncbi:hypothetical protein [Planomicrobium sp. CPCC 101079]|uniref:hypothetical protein n=1 Tax=Planomicrobium sp. CPCC 101079 TaxID=2599618 RepID=UPI0016446B0D|nr:hypothetical protein [Planomicrobium sp. CPCC 101079]
MSNQNKGNEIADALKRKILAAVLSSLLFAMIFSMFGGFDVEGDGFANMYYLNFMFVNTYGVATSLFSDWLSRKLAERAFTREIISFLFHCLFGAILLVMSLISAISFFVVDRLLRKARIGWLPVALALAAAVVVFIVLLNK